MMRKSGARGTGFAKSKYVLGVALSLLTAAVVVTDVEAARMGGARSSGVQRSVTTNRQASAPPQTQQAAAAQPAAAQAAPAQGGGKWLPLLGGLAIGGLLGSMISAGGGMGGILMVLLLAVGAALLFGMLRQRRGEANALRYAGAGAGAGDPAMGNETVVAPPPSQAAGFEPPQRQTSPNLPADFDAQGFLRAAKLNFIKMQVANDLGDLDQIREFTTTEMYAELARDIQERKRGGRLLPQQTDVVTLNADMLDVVSEQGRYLASVRFSGMMQELAGSAPVGFEEVWNLAKPEDGSTGWLLAGIQQMH
ncbi:MAG: Tim44-like domain-containing protein [Betaproteobacteria bacterium]|nr:Tim44-like domain-containing protein [Betaproteobacteria bacterium]